MTFINLDSGGKVTAEWGVGRRKQGKQQKTHNGPLPKPVCHSHWPYHHLLPGRCYPNWLTFSSPHQRPSNPHRVAHILTTELMMDPMSTPEASSLLSPAPVSFRKGTPSSPSSGAPAQFLAVTPGPGGITCSRSGVGVRRSLSLG